jgi:RNA polymerase sigma factor (sigma-70 family)
MTGHPATHTTVEAIARHSYGKLIAYLASRFGDVASAEDALSEAFAAALRRWPADGVPRKPEAWLLRVAHNRMLDAARHEQVREKYEQQLRQYTEEACEMAETLEQFPDERLKLLFVCAHPAIDVAVRTPLMLQAVMGLDAARIASAFLVSPAAMSQRLVRAKSKIKEAAIPFRVPEPSEWDERVSFVLDAIYSAYTAGWESLGDAGSAHYALASEAIELGRAMVQLIPNEPEARGLLALMLHCEARKLARYTPDGEFVPLDQQDVTLWLQAELQEAEYHLREASSMGRPGRFQLEAAIQSIHAFRAASGKTDWQEILVLYEGLLQIAPRIGSLVGRAVAMAQVGKPEAALKALEELPVERIVDYQPYWAARGHVLRLLNQNEEASQAFIRAASLTDDPALKRHLFRRSAGHD